MSKVKFTGKNEDDALKKASHDLNLKPSAIQYEIVSRSSGILGLLGQTLTIEVTLPEEEDQPVAEAPQKKAPAQPRKEAKKAKEEAPEKKEPRSRKPKPAPKKSEDGEREQPRKESRPKADKGSDQPRPRRSEKPAAADGEETETTIVDEKIFSEKQSRAAEVMGEMLKRMESDAVVTVGRDGAEIVLTVQGTLPEWFGRGQSRVADSLQFILNKIVNRFPPRYRVVLNLEAQKEQREKELEELAVRLVSQVKETGTSMWILPMSPRERRIVHLAIAGAEGVATRSVGYGATRRLCLYRED